MRACLYILQGNYGHGWEDLTAAPATTNGWKEIKQNKREYLDNEGLTYRIIKRRIPRSHL